MTNRLFGVLAAMILVGGCATNPRPEPVASIGLKKAEFADRCVFENPEPKEGLILIEVKNCTRTNPDQFWNRSARFPIMQAYYSPELGEATYAAYLATMSETNLFITAATISLPGYETRIDPVSPTIADAIGGTVGLTTMHALYPLPEGLVEAAISGAFETSQDSIVLTLDRPMGRLQQASIPIVELSALHDYVDELRAKDKGISSDE